MATAELSFACIELTAPFLSAAHFFPAGASAGCFGLGYRRPSCAMAAASAPRVPRKLRFGSDFSGIDGWLVGLRRLGINYTHEFSSDIEPSARKLIQAAHKPNQLFENVLDRLHDDAVYTDVYTWSPPCQDFSSAGKMKGLAGTRDIGNLVKKSIMYIKRRRPRLTIMENVASLASHKKFKPIERGITTTLQALNYKVFTKVLDSHHYGSPAHRRRYYLVAIRGDSLRRAFKWPKQLAVSARITMFDVLEPLSDTDKPGRLPTHKREKGHALSAFRAAWKEGVDATSTPVIVDIDGSPNFKAWGIRVAGTLTRKRGQSGGPWVSCRGRRTTLWELMAMQGFVHTDLPWEEAGVSRAQIGGMLGNSVHVGTVGHLLAEALFASGIALKKPLYAQPALPYLDTN